MFLKNMFMKLFSGEPHFTNVAPSLVMKNLPENILVILLNDCNPRLFCYDTMRTCRTTNLSNRSRRANLLNE